MMEAQCTPTNTQNNNTDQDVVDAVFDNMCPVPENLGQTAVMEGNFEKPQASRNATVAADTQEETTVDPVVDSQMKSDDDDTLEKLCSKFDVNCCAKHSNKQVEVAEVPIEGDELAEKEDDKSLAEIAARINEIDLESGGDTAEDPENGFHSAITKSVTPWYREPFYAALICT